MVWVLESVLDNFALVAVPGVGQPQEQELVDTSRPTEFGLALRNSCSLISGLVQRHCMLKFARQIKTTTTVESLHFFLYFGL